MSQFSPRSNRIAGADSEVLTLLDQGYYFLKQTIFKSRHSLGLALLLVVYLLSNWSFSLTNRKGYSIDLGDILFILLLLLILKSWLSGEDPLNSLQELSQKLKGKILTISQLFEKYRSEKFKLKEKDFIDLGVIPNISEKDQENLSFLVSEYQNQNDESFGFDPSKEGITVKGLTKWIEKRFNVDLSQLPSLKNADLAREVSSEEAQSLIEQLKQQEKQLLLNRKLTPQEYNSNKLNFINQSLKPFVPEEDCYRENIQMEIPSQMKANNNQKQEIELENAFERQNSNSIEQQQLREQDLIQKLAQRLNKVDSVLDQFSENALQNVNDNVQSGMNKLTDISSSLQQLQQQLQEQYEQKQQQLDQQQYQETEQQFQQQQEQSQQENSQQQQEQLQQQQQEQQQQLRAQQLAQRKEQQLQQENEQQNLLLQLETQLNEEINQSLNQLQFSQLQQNALNGILEEIQELALQEESQGQTKKMADSIDEQMKKIVENPKEAKVNLREYVIQLTKYQSLLGISFYDQDILDRLTESVNEFISSVHNPQSSESQKRKVNTQLEAHKNKLLLSFKSQIFQQHQAEQLKQVDIEKEKQLKADIKQRDSQIKKLGKRNADVEEKIKYIIEQQSQEKHQLQYLVKQLNDQLDSNLKQIEQLTQQLKDKQSEFDLSNKDIEQKKQQITDLETEVSNKNKQLEDLNFQLSQSQQKGLDQQQQLADKAKQSEEQQNSINQLQKDLQESTDKVNQQKEQLRSAHVTLLKSQQKVEGMKFRSQQQTDQIKDNATKLEQQQAKLDQRAAEIESQKSQIQDQQNKLQESNAALEESQKKSDHLNSQLEGSKQQLQDATNSMNDQIKLLNDDISNKQKLINDFCQKGGEQGKQLSQLSLQINDLQSQLQTKTQENLELTNSLSDNQQKQAGLQKDLQDVNHLIQQKTDDQNKQTQEGQALQQQLNDSVHKVDQLTKQLEELATKLNDSEYKNVRDQQKIERLNLQQQNLETTEAELKEQLQKSEENGKQLAQQNQAGQQQLSDANNKTQELQQTIDQLQKQVVDQQAIIEDLKNQIEKLQKELEEVKIDRELKINTLNDTIEYNQKKLEEAEKKILEITNEQLEKKLSSPRERQDSSCLIPSIPVLKLGGSEELSNRKATSYQASLQILEKSVRGITEIFYDEFRNTAYFNQKELVDELKAKYGEAIFSEKPLNPEQSNLVVDRFQKKFIQSESSFLQSSLGFEVNPQNKNMIITSIDKNFELMKTRLNKAKDISDIQQLKITSEADEREASRIIDDIISGALTDSDDTFNRQLIALKKIMIKYKQPNTLRMSSGDNLQQKERTSNASQVQKIKAKVESILTYTSENMSKIKLQMKQYLSEDMRSTLQQKIKEWRLTVEEKNKVIKKWSLQSQNMWFTLTWHDSNDLDLVVKCPCGQKIYYGTKKCENCGTFLEIDMNAGGNKNDKFPIEHIYLQKQPKVGSKWEVYCKMFHCNNNKDSPFTIQIEHEDGRIVSYQGTLDFNINPKSPVYTYMVGKGLDPKESQLIHRIRSAIDSQESFTFPPNDITELN